jgi:carbon monoxide dehydrogenase subunit G
MSYNSEYKSRVGIMTCSSEEIYNFVTDIRNFEQFIPAGTINNWQAEKESCSFSVSMLGNVSFRLSEKEMYKKVVFKGDALKKNDFNLTLNINSDHSNSAKVDILLNADLNPMLKMIAEKPIKQFLESLINEMEIFGSWNYIKQ